MADLRSLSKELVARALNELISEKNIELGKIEGSSIAAETPPSPDMGDIGFPLFQFAKTFKMAPPLIAKEVLAKISPIRPLLQKFLCGQYLNVKLQSYSVGAVLERVKTQEPRSGSFNAKNEPPLKNTRVSEFSSPNNKPLHLGHLRNDALGKSVSHI